jgi:hypothetical protein
LIYSFAAFHFRLRAAQQRCRLADITLIFIFRFRHYRRCAAISILPFSYFLFDYFAMPFRHFSCCHVDAFHAAFPIRFFDTPLLAAFAAQLSCWRHYFVFAISLPLIFHYSLFFIVLRIDTPFHAIFLRRFRFSFAITPPRR